MHPIADGCLSLKMFSEEVARADETCLNDWSIAANRKDDGREPMGEH
jgi:hypothetical protein